MRVSTFLLVLAACSDAPSSIDGAIGLDRPPLQKQGQFIVLQTTQAPIATVIAGYFGTNVRAPIVTERDQGPCHITREGEPSRVLDSAGQMRVTASGPSTSIVTLQPTAAAYSDSTDSLRYLGGESLLIEGMGAVVPAFSATIEVPRRLQLTETSILFHKNDDFTISWDPVDNDVMLTIIQSPTTIRCTFAGATGTGTAPAAAFSDMIVSQPGRMSVGTDVRGDTMAGDYALELETVFIAVSAPFTVSN